MQPEINTQLKTSDLQTLTDLFEGSIYLPTEKADAAAPLVFSGSIEKGIVMLVTHPLNADERDQLQKICSFLQLDISEVAMVNINEQTVTQEKLVELGTKKIVCWGIAPNTLFDCENELYTPLKLGDIDVIASISLAQLSHDSPAKKVLASGLKLIF